MSFRLLVISHPEHHAGELAALPALFATGLERFHVRKPGWSAVAVEAFIAAVPKVFHSRLVLHAHPQLVRHYQLGGLHLTASQRAVVRRRPSLLVGQSLSTSFHSLAEINRTRRRYDYAFLSPIFDSVSKVGYTSHFSVLALQTYLRRRSARAGYQLPVLALGGVTVETIGQLPFTGFVGAAVLGSIWQSPDPVAAFGQLQAAAYASAASQSFHTGS